MVCQESEGSLETDSGNRGGGNSVQSDFTSQAGQHTKHIVSLCGRGCLFHPHLVGAIVLALHSTTKLSDDVLFLTQAKTAFLAALPPRLPCRLCTTCWGRTPGARGTT